MGFTTVSVGRGCCLASKKKKKIAKISNLCVVFAEILILVAFLILEELRTGEGQHGVERELRDQYELKEMKSWLKIVIIIIIGVNILMQAVELKAFLRPNTEEKFSLTIQGSHERKPSRHRKTFYGVTTSDEVQVDYDRNSEGILVYFRKVTSGKCNRCQPCMLPLRGWFTFFHVIIALTLLICFIIINALTLLILFVCFILQSLAIISSYYSAEDCGFCCLSMSYTRWYKHTNAYTEMIQGSIQAKHGQKLKQEGDQLELDIRANKRTRMVNDADHEVTVHDVGPQTAKRYQDQLVLLHLLLAQEHDEACKNVFPDYDIENKGVSFTLTAEEINTLVTFVEESMERAGTTVVDAEMVSNGAVEPGDQTVNAEGLHM